MSWFPNGDAVVFLSVEGEAQDPQEFAMKFMTPLAERFNLEILRDNPIKVGGIDSWRVAAKGNVGGRRLAGQITFIPYNGLMYRITAVAPKREADHYIAQARNTVRSFRPLPADANEGFEIMRLRITRAKPGESVADLMKRTSSALRPGGIEVINGVFDDHCFKGDELVAASGPVKLSFTSDVSARLAEQPGQRQFPLIGGIVRLAAKVARCDTTLPGNARTEVSWSWNHAPGVAAWTN